MKTNAVIKQGKSGVSQMYEEAAFVMQQAIVAAKNGKREEMVTEVRRTLRKIEKYDFNRLSSELARFLQYYYFYFANDRVRGQKYDEKRESYAKLAFIEEEIEAQYARISYKLKASGHPDKNLREELNTICENCIQHLALENATISISIYSMLVINAHLKDDLLTCIKYCQEAIVFLEDRNINRSFYFYYYMVPILIERKSFDEARLAISNALRSIKKRSNHHSRYMVYNIILALHAGEYQQAYEMYMQVGRIAEKTMSEQYKIIKGYLSFLMKTGYIQGEHQFKLGKFINEVPIFNKDKAGYNINILVLQFLHFLKRENGRIVDMMDAINTYRSRYLSGRYNVFLKMLLKIPKYQFNPIAIRYRTESELADLNKHRMNVDIEIVPFDRLWEMIIQHLEE